MSERINGINRLVLDSLRADEAVMRGSSPSDRREKQDHAFVVRARLGAALAALPARGNGVKK